MRRCLPSLWRSRFVGGRLLLALTIGVALLGAGTVLATRAGAQAPGPAAPRPTHPPLAPQTLCLAANPVQNPGFEAGSFPPWVILSSHPTPAVTTVRPHTGTYSAKLGCTTCGMVEPLGSSAIYQQFTVPPTGGVLSFWYWPYSLDFGADDQEALVTDLNNTVLATIMDVDENDQVWKNVQYDMGAYSGQTIRIQFAVLEDGASPPDPTAMYVDDLEWYQPCPTATPTPPPPTPIPPTATNTPVPPPTATPTPPPAPSATARPPSATPGPSNTPLLTATATPRPAGSPTASTTPSPTRPAGPTQTPGAATATATATPAASTTPCPISTLADIWLTGAAYPIPIEEEAIAAQAGVLYSFGGQSNGTTVANAYKYVPGQGWRAIHALPQAVRQASAVGDGTYLYILNGLGSSSYQNILDRYDPATDTYLALPPSLTGTAAQAAVYLAGKIYRLGGSTGARQATSTVEVYNVAAGTWAGAAPYPQALSWVTAVAVSGQIYAAGGYDPVQQASTPKGYHYDPAADRWDDAGLPDLPAPRYGAAGGLVNGRWVLAGGNEAGVVVASTLSWDLTAAGAWTALPPMGQPRSYLSGAALGLSFLAVGGSDGTNFNGTADVQNFAAPSFWDVLPAAYFYTPVLYLACHGVISGYGDMTFRPYNQTTRSQMVKIVVLGFNKPIQTPAGGNYTFADVPPSFAFFGVIETAVAGNIVSGYACGGGGEPCDSLHRPYFRPYAYVTRGQLSKITAVAAGWPLITPASATFADVAPGTAFAPFVETAACHGIVSGYACGGAGEPCDAQRRPYFRPYNQATRGQIAKIVDGALTGSQPCAAGPGAAP